MGKRKTIEDCHKLAETKGGKFISTRYINANAKYEWECKFGHRFVKSYLVVAPHHGVWCPHCSKYKKGTIQDCHSVAEKNNGKCLSKLYTNCRKKYKWKCKSGHVFEANYHNVKNGLWCVYCSKCRRKTIEDYIELAEKNKGELLSPSCSNVRTKLKWKCSLGHEFLMNYTSVKRGNWCPICSTVGRRKTIEDCRNLALKNDGEFLSTSYAHDQDLLKWKCKLGHEFLMRFASIRSGQWCPICGGTQRKTVEDCKKLAQKMNGEFLSTEYTNANAEYKWKCNSGHEFLRTYIRVYSRCWCPKCALEKKITTQKCQKLAQNMGGEFLSDSYTGNKIKYKWKCKFGHEFFSNHSEIKRGCWCPKCKGIRSKSQEKIIEILNSIFGPIEIRNNFQEFDWLRTFKSGKQELDLWIPSLKLAIEYDGEQHFRAVEYFGGESHFLRTQQLDLLKNQKIAAHPEDVHYFIRFNYKETITEDYVRNKLIEHCVPIPTIP